jgi:hypothetical protein
MLCNKLFGLNQDTTAALVNLKLFWNKGLRCYQGENVALARKEILAVCSRLSEAKELLQETPVDLLTGLTLCLVDEFKTLFKHKLQVAKAESLEGNHHLSQPEIMEEVRVLLASAAQYYNSLNMSDNWNLPQNQCLNTFATLWEQRTHVGIEANQTIPLINAPSLKMKSGLLKIVASGWRQMDGIPRGKERAVVATTSEKSGVLLSQESWVFAMLMGPPTPTVERSIMGLNVVGTGPTQQSFTRNGQQKALFLTFLGSAHLMNWS